MSLLTRKVRYVVKVKHTCVHVFINRRGENNINNIKYSRLQPLACVHALKMGLNIIRQQLVSRSAVGPKQCNLIALSFPNPSCVSVLKPILDHVSNANVRQEWHRIN